MNYRDSDEKERVEANPLVIQAREHLRRCEDAVARCTPSAVEPGPAQLWGTWMPEPSWHK